MAVRLLVAVLIILTIHESFNPTNAITVKYWCQEPSDDSNYFRFVVRLDREGESTITGITAVDASTTPTDNSVPTESTCKTTSEESSGIYVLSQEVGQNEECGVNPSGGDYDVQINAVGTKQYFTFTCDPNDLLPNSVSAENFATTGVTNVLRYQENPYGVKFQAFEADHSYAPVRGPVELGQNIKLRLIYHTEHVDSKYDTWGTVFHTGFIHHSSQKITLQIVTPGLGTSVHITGKLPGYTIDEWVTVKRDRWAEVEILIPDYYDRGSAADDDWIIATKGIKIESLHDIIGVIVRGSSDGNADQYVVYPDDVLTTSRIRVLGSDSDPNADQEIVVIATEDNTDVTIRYNNFNKPGGLEVNGNNVGGGSSSTTVSLDEYEILYIVCKDECYELTIEGDKKISIVTGFEDENHKDNNDKGTSSTQLIAEDYYADKFVFVESLFGNTGYFIYTRTPTQTSLRLTDDTRNADSIGSPYYLDWTGESEAEFDSEVAAYMYATGSGSTTPAMVQYPSLAQWSTYNSFPVKEGITYSITIVTTKGDAADIKVYIGGVTTSFTAATLGDGANFNSKLQDVSKLSTAGAGDANYEVYNNQGEFTVIDQDPTVTERGFIEFIAGKAWKPFMVLIHEIDGDAQSLHLPIGVRYPVTYDCSTSSTQPGDNIDNDCDGREGEEILNGVDDDGDGKTDEDLALSPVTPSFRGIYVKDLYVDDNSAFSSPIQLHSSGCNVIDPPANTVNTKVLSTIGPFERNTALNSIYSTHWVIETPAFNAFKFVGQSTVYFRVTFDVCTADLTLCVDSCQTNRKRKRSLTEEENFIDLMINIQGNDTAVHIVDSNVVNVRDAKNRDASRRHNTVHPCTHNAVLWLPVALLLVILLFEAAMTVVFLRMRSKFKNRM